ncbi:MAG: hypothetical protein ACJ8AK_03020 [Gemmatimonadaceae bacterium]
MITLPILEDELRIPLDEAGFPGVVAVVRPLDIVDASKWRDAFPTDDAKNAAATELVRAQLVRIEGMQMRQKGSSPVPYDHSDPRHFRSIPPGIRNAIYNGLMSEVNVSGEQEKNSEPPSGSDGKASLSEPRTDDDTPPTAGPAASE